VCFRRKIYREYLRIAFEQISSHKTIYPRKKDLYINLCRKRSHV